jgi:Immunoglobulin domain
MLGDLKFFGGGRTNVVPARTVAGLFLLLLLLMAAAFPSQAQSGLNGTFHVTENWTVTYIDAPGGAGYPTVYHGQDSGTLTVANGQYTLIDHSGIAGGDTFNTQVHTLSGGPPYNSLGVEYPFAGTAIASNGLVNVMHLSFFSIPIPASTFNSDSTVVANKSSFYTTTALSGSGSNDLENVYYFTASSTSSLVQEGGIAPEITSGPDNQGVLAGSNATFTVSATGSPAPSFQWRFNGTNIALATAISYTVTNAQVADEGAYSVIVSNDAGTVTSSNASLTLVPPQAPAITNQPQGLTVALGSNATFTVSASGLPTPSYQWQFNGTNILLATGTSYTVTNAQISDEGEYSVIVSNFVSSVTSSNALLTVAPAPFFDAEAPLGGGWYWLQDTTSHIFGYYTYSFPYIYHLDMGWEYFIDAGNANDGGYFYDFTDDAFFYTEPDLFPSIYDFKASAWLYYDPVAGSPGRYTSSPRWFYNFSTGQWGNHL